MWSFRNACRPLIMATAIGAGAMMLSGCAFTPVYGDHGAARALHLAYAAPTSRAEQIVYQDLAYRLGKPDPGSALVTVSVTDSDRTVFQSASDNPVTPKELTLTGKIRVTSQDASHKVLFSGTRTATASYTTNGQAVADEEARYGAVETAAHALAETIGLTLVAVVPETTAGP